MADPETTPLFCPRWQFLVLLAQWCQDAGRISQLWVLSLFLVPVMKNIDSYDRESVWRSILDGVSAADNYSHQDIQDMSSSKTGRRGLYMLVGRITSSKTSLCGYYLLYSEPPKLLTNLHQLPLSRLLWVLPAPKSKTRGRKAWWKCWKL